MKTTFLIVNYNDYLTTIELINNIKDYKLITEIVVVDNNSTDASFEKLSELKIKKLTVIKSEKNGGYSYALNIGSRYLIDKYERCNIFISNSDIIIKSEEDLEKLVEKINERTVVVAPKINTHGVISYGWRLPRPMDEVLFNIPGIQNKVKEKMDYDEFYFDKKNKTVDAVSGCFFLIDSRHLEKTKYFDDKVFLYYEENILATKTKKSNKRTLLVFDVEVLHNHSVTINKHVKKINKVKIQKKSQLYFEKKYNNANFYEILLLRLTAFLAIILLSIKYKVGK